VFPSPSQGEGQGEGTIPTRYGYVGAWGYQGNPLSTGQALDGPGGLCDPAGPEAHCDPVALLGWLHVGERYYDPATGRFLQRDPFGISGGLNVYGYAGNLPSLMVDPLGLAWWNPFDYEPIADATIWITDTFNDTTGINLDCQEAVAEASRGFRNTGFAAAGAAAGWAAPGLTGVACGAGGLLAEKTGITSTGDPALDEAVESLTEGLTVGGFRSGPTTPKPRPVPWEIMNPLP